MRQGAVHLGDLALKCTYALLDSGVAVLQAVEVLLEIRPAGHRQEDSDCRKKC